MPKQFTNIIEPETAARDIQQMFDSHAEWLYARAGRVEATLRSCEMELSAAHGRLLFACQGSRGAELWRVNAWEWTGDKLLLAVARRTGRERATLELIPRVKSSTLAEELGQQRRARCARLAQLAVELWPGAKVERAALSRGSRRNQPGGYARILLKRGRDLVAVTGDVTAARDVDAYLSTTLIWFARLLETARGPLVRKLWIAVLKESAQAMLQRVALLRDDLGRAIMLYEIDAEWQSLAELQRPHLEELLMMRPARISRPSSGEMSEAAARIAALAPEAIDVVRARRGETLRFHGLSFARVRRVMNRELVWFGIEGPRRRLLEESTWEELEKLLSELKEHRCATASDHYHALYRLVPEAWLESILRRDITRLDPGLRLAPLHAQFRTSQESAASARPIDLLAMRRDGRLVVIELKVSEDREHVLQAADYWRRIETYRRAGHLRRARLFDDRVISDETPLVYLAAPGLRFHRSFNTLARAITPRIEMYRFDLNEDWRSGVRVLRRCEAVTNSLR